MVRTRRKTEIDASPNESDNNDNILEKVNYE